MGKCHKFRFNIEMTREIQNKLNSLMIIRQDLLLVDSLLACRDCQMKYCTSTFGKFTAIKDTVID